MSFRHRSPLVFLATLLLAGAAFAQDTRTVVEPVIPAVKCAVLQASLTADSTPSGGLTLAQETSFDTSRIQAALTACTSGQAVELAPSGAFNAFLIQPISIPAGVTLLVDAGVTVLASRNPADYQKGTSTNCGTAGNAGSGCQPLIVMNNAPGSAIMGYGAIDGRGGATMLVNGADSGQTWWDLAIPGTEVSPVLLNVGSSVNVTLYRITFQNAPHFHVTASSADNMIVWGTKIITPYDTHNTDGFDPGGFNNTTVQDAYFSDGDDEIALTGGSSPLTQNMTVNNAHFFSGHGMSIGSHTTYGIQNLFVNNLTINEDPNDKNGTGLRIKSDATSGGLVQNVTYQNVCMQNVAAPILMTAYYTTSAGTSIPQFRNINFHNVHALTPGNVQFLGYDNATTNGITDLLGLNFNNVAIDGATTTNFSSQYAQLAFGPDPVSFANLVAGVGVSVTNNVSNANAYYSCPAAIFNVLAGEIVHGPSTVTSTQSVTLQTQIITPRETSYATYLTAKSSNAAATLRLPIPTGTVSLLEGTKVLGTATLVPGNAQVNTNLLSINIGTLTTGTHTITGSYSGDGNYGAQSFGSYKLLVTAGASTTTTLAASATALIPGQTVTFTAQVASAVAGTPTGTVTFFDGSYPLATTAVGGTGAASFTTTSLSNITHTLTAVYSGDATYTTSNSSAVVVTVTQAQSLVTFTANTTTATQGQPVTFTASVAPSNGTSSDVPTGNMAFKDNGKTPSNMTLANGVATYTTTTMTVGSHTTFGSYGGDVNFASAVSPNLIVTIVAGATTTASLTTSTTAIFPYQNVTLTASVASTTAGTPTGSFTFYDGTTSLGTVALTGLTATLNTTALGIGSHSITATYNGDVIYAPSTTAATVIAASLAPTTLTLASSATTGRATPGQSITFTASLAAPSGGSPTGAVSLYDGLALIATITPASGTATFSTTALAAGAHTLLASYAGDANFGASQSNSIYLVVSASATGTPVSPVLLPQVITTIAGNGTAGTSGDGGLASASTVSADLRGIAVDGFGTVFVQDSTNSRIRAINPLTGNIKTIQGGGSVCSGHTDTNGDGCLALQTSIKGRGIATDKAGNLFIAGYGDNLIHRIDAVTTTTTLVAGQVASVSSMGTAGVATDGTVATAAPLSGPRGVWIDNLGNVFIADVGNRQIRMVYNAGSFSGLSTTTLVKGAIYLVAGNAGSTNVDKGLATATGTAAPQGVYVDNQQNIFIPDSTRLRVVYEGGAGVAALIAATNSGTVATPGYIYTVAGGGSTAYTPGSVVLGTSVALGGIARIAPDANGNLYLADGTKNVVWFFDVQTGYIRTVAGGATTVCAGATDTIGDGCPALSATLNVGSSAQAVAFDASSNLYITDPGNARVRKVSPNLSFPATATGASLTQPLQVHFGPGDAAAGYTLPIASGDFALTGTPACTVNNDTTTDCTLQIAFTPAKPGSRAVPLTITANSGAVAVFTLTGTGTGPALVVDPGAAATLGAGLAPQGVATDPAGNIYVADKASGSLLRFAASSTTSTTVLSGLASPYQVTIDGAGSLYVADSGNNRVVKLSATGVVSTVGTGLKAPRGVAVDSIGDVYIADTGNSRIVEVPAAPGTQIIVGSGLSGPTSLAIDAANNLYILDQGNARVVEIAAGTTAMPVLSLGSILPAALALDAASDLYVADSAGQQVLMYAPGSSTGSVVATNVAAPAGIDLDGRGNLYIADSSGTSLTVINRTTGKATFASASTPITVALTNVGNASLNFAAPGLTASDTTNFSVGAAASNGCSLTNGSLAAGAACGVTAIYAPQSTGTQTDNVSFLSNGGAVSLSLTGTGVTTIGTTTTVSAPTPASPSFGQSVSFTATVAAKSGTTTPTGTVTLTVDTTSLTPLALTNGQATGSFSGLAAGAHTVSALYTPAAGFASSSAQPASFTIGKITPTVNWSPAASASYGTALSLVENANSNGVAGTFTYTATPAGGSATAITATSFLPVGSYSLAATFTPTDAVDYNTATATIASFTITKASTTPGVGPTQNVVAADGSANFPTLTAAIAALPTTGGAIYVRPGTYTGQNLISTANVQLRGLGGDPTKVVLTGSNSAGTKGSDQASATLGVTGNGFYMENLSINNTFQADNPTVTFNTQSIAVWLTGDKDVVYNSQMASQQDTLYANNGPSRQYFNTCKVAGNIDYIFGDSAAVFDNCNIYTVFHGSTSAATTITAQKKLYAAGTANDYLSGYVIINSQITAQTDQGTPTNLLYGRPWGPYSTNVFINDYIQTVAPVGWTEFTPGTTNNLPTSTYGEYGNYGPGYSTVGREQYAIQLTAAQAAAYAPDTYLSGPDSWSPTAALKSYIAAVVPTATSLSITPGSSVTMVARVAPPALGTPTGTLTFRDGTSVLATVTLDALGEASYTTSSLGNGSHSITVAYSGDTNFNASTSAAVVVTAGTGSATTLQLGATSTTYGQSTTATATISAASGTGVPTGSATFTLDGTALTPVSLVAGKAVLTIPATTAAGTHTIGVSYTGDTTYGASQATAMTLTVAKASLTVTGNTASMSYGGTVPAISALITGYVNGEGSSAVTGAAALSTTALATSPVGSYPVVPALGTLSAANYSFTFVNGAITVNKLSATVTVANAGKVYGAALPTFTSTSTGLVNGDTFTVTYTTTATAASAVGSYPITATVAGAASGNYTITVVPAALTVTTAPLTVTVAAASKVYGAALPTFTATAATLVNGDALGTTLTATYTTTATAASAVGSYPINATVAGTASGNYTITVVPAALTVTAAPLTVTVAATSKVYGAALPTFSASAATLVNGDTLGTTLTATYTTTATAASAVGSYPVNATVAGTASGNYSITVVPGSLAVTKAGSSATVTSSAASVVTGVSATLTATVTSPAGTPTGTVTFLDGTTSLGTGTLNASGVATLSTSAFTLGANAITVSYAGDVNFAASVSAATTVTGVVPASFSLNSSPASLTIASGSTGTAVITLTPVGGYLGTATLSCGTLPANVFCTFKPATLVADGTNTPSSSTLTISTNGAAAQLAPTANPRSIYAALLLSPLGLLLAARKRRRMATLFLLFLAALGASGCGGSPTSHNAAAGTSTIVVTATVNGVAAQSINLSVTIR